MLLESFLDTNTHFVHISSTPAITSVLGVHDMQQASRKAEPGDYKHAVNDM